MDDDVFDIGDRSEPDGGRAQHVARGCWWGILSPARNRWRETVGTNEHETGRRSDVR